MANESNGKDEVSSGIKAHPLPTWAEEKWRKDEQGNFNGKADS